MCGGVRGVGGGGIVSTAFCILYKLYTLKLTRKQVLGLMVHKGDIKGYIKLFFKNNLFLLDSPFIRGLGFMYVRYTQPPEDLFNWYEPYLDDTEVSLIFYIF
jgi:pre-mRNA-splicing factor 38B